MKFVKILLINVILFILLLFLLEICLFISFKRTHPNIKYHLKSISYEDYLKTVVQRFPVGLNYKKRPIILSGCSYIYGLYFEGIHTPQYKLSELSKRPVYNYAIPGKGIQHTLYVLSHKLYDKNINNPEYFIYFMISDHIRRMYSPVMFNDCVANPVFNVDKYGHVIEYKGNYPLYKKTFTYYYFFNIYYFNFFNKDYITHRKNIVAYFREMNRLLKNSFPDIKLVIILYDDLSPYDIVFSSLKNDGIIVYKANELTDVNLINSKYWISKTDPHPNEAAWDVLMPKLVEKLNL